MNLVMRHLRRGHRPRLRQEDRGRHSRRGAARPGGDRGLPRSRRLMTPLLELEGVEARYGPVKAAHGVSLTVGEGEIVAVLGGNGAGKTTMLRAISGLVTMSGECASPASESRARRRSESRASASPTSPGPRDLQRALGAREPPARRVPAPRRLRRRLRAGRGYFPGSRSAKTSRRARSPAASSRCSRSPALMGRPRTAAPRRAVLGLAPLVVREIFRIVGELTRRYWPPSSSRTRSWRCARPAAPTCSRSGGSRSKARAPSWSRTTRWRKAYLGY